MKSRHLFLLYLFLQTQSLKMELNNLRESLRIAAIYCFLGSVIFLAGCSGRKASRSKKESGVTATYAAFADNRQITPLLRDEVFALDSVTLDATYGYTRENPILSGGFQEQSGARNQQRFLNALLGPESQRVQYQRVGSCCSFNTPNGMMGRGLLDRYKVYWENCTDTVFLYMNLYDAGPLKAPQGFLFRKPVSR